MAGSFMTSFESLLALRCLGGIGGKTGYITFHYKRHQLHFISTKLLLTPEASYSSIGPSVIGDMYVGNTRSKMLAFFYFTTIIGG